MRTVWHALAWKEWHEFKWKLAAILAILIACVSLVMGNYESDTFSAIQIAIILPIIPISVVIATSVATSERSRGTLPFLTALPVSQRTAAVVKLVAGLGTCLVPIFLVLLTLYAWYLGWDYLGVNYQASMNNALRGLPKLFNSGNWFLAVGCSVTFWVVSLFLWTATTGVSRADEISAAAIAMIVMAAIWLALFGIGLSLTDDPFENLIPKDEIGLIVLAFGIAPGGFVLLDEVWELGPPLALAALILYVVVHSILAIWFVRRFGRNSDRTILSRRTNTSTGNRIACLAPPRQSRLSAIAWKQRRESGPVVWTGLGGVAAILGITLIAWTRSRRDVTDLRDMFAGAMFFGCLYLGGLTTLVVGIGVFLRDLSPGLHTFWRSRPISPQTWYWIKYATGLTIVFLAFQLPMLLFPVLASTRQVEHFNGTPEFLRIQILGVAAYMAIYSISVAVTCLTRNAVYATVLSMLAMYGGILLLVGAVYSYQWITGDERAADWLEGRQSTPTWIAAMMGVSIFAAVLGWLAVRRDWGWKSRY